MRRVRASAAAGLLYFCAVFAAGFVLGPIRVLLLEPRVGELAAVAIEAPFLIAAMFFAARFLVGNFGLNGARPSQAAMGLLALALLLVMEEALAWLLRGQPLEQHARHYLSPPGLLSLALFALFAAMPAVANWRRPT